MSALCPLALVPGPLTVSRFLSLRAALVTLLASALASCGGGGSTASTPGGIDDVLADSGGSTGASDTALPETALPDSGNPDTPLPDANVPDTPLPDANVPDANVPDVPDPCAAANGGCDAKATCASTAGAAKCTCKAGFEGDGKTCAPIVTLTALNHHDWGAGKLSVPEDTSGWTSVAAIATVDGKPVTYPASAPVSGVFSIPGVPVGPYRLVITRAPPASQPGASPSLTVYDTSERALDLSTAHSYRPDVTAITQPTWLTVKGKLTAPWKTYAELPDGTVVNALEDLLFFMGRGSDAAGSVQTQPDGEHQSGAPKNGDAALAGWKLNALQYLGSAHGAMRSLVESGKGDALTVLHGRVTEVQTAAPLASDPWGTFSYTTAVEWLTTSSLAMTDGGSFTVEGDFQAGNPQSFVLKYAGASFASSLAEAPAPLHSGELRFDVFFECGAPVPAKGAYATLVELVVPAKKAYVDLKCNPGSCDVAACLAGCSAEKKLYFPGDREQSFSFVNPFDFGQLLASATVAFRGDVTALLPADTGIQRVRGHLSMTGPAATLSGTALAPTIGLPRNLRVNGKPVPLATMTTGVGTGLTVAFDPPALGTPFAYRVQLRELDDLKDAQGKVISAERVVLTVNTIATELVLPAGSLLLGRHYALTVEARAGEGYDPKLPNAYLPHSASAQNTTGVFAPCACAPAATGALEDGKEKCTCLSGYTGDGKVCHPNVCLKDNGGCHAQANCTSQDGLATCTCKSGWAGDGKVCAVDPCLPNNGGCTGEGVICVADGGTTKCACKSGWGGNPSIGCYETCLTANDGECMPVTNAGCDGGLGFVCDRTASGTFKCYPPPNDALPAAACSQSSGPYCVAGYSCSNAPGVCVKFCCADAECAANATCVPLKAGQGTIGLCTPK